MREAIWDAFLTDRDRQVFSGAGYGVRAAMPDRPALVLLRGDCSARSHTLAEPARIARTAGLPVIHVVENHGLGRGRGGPDRPETMVPGSAASDVVLERFASSAFFDSDLMSHLNLLRADGVILAGYETSGAVRATAIDAFSLNLRSIVVSDTCFDSWEASHALTLFDLDAKHSNVMDSAELEQWLHELPAALFDLPAGASAPGAA